MAHFSLDGRTVVLTGGTGGFARALVPALLDKGARVGLIDLDGDAVEALTTSLGEPARVQGRAGDVTDNGSLVAAVDALADHFGGIDVAIANAGVGGTPTALADAPLDVWDRMIDINLNGVFRTFRAALPHVRKTRGYLLATSSMAAFVHTPLQGAYPAAKAGVWALCDTLRLELQHEGVAVGSLHPSYFKTPMVDSVMDDPAAGPLWFKAHGGPFDLIPIEDVVRDTVKGIESRARQVVCPRSLRLASVAPRAFQHLVERRFTPERVQAAIERARARDGEG